ncbi:MAG: type III PLP-dependent enzyme [Sphingomonadaceae bacterium]|nr:type III PLP-dependent enzyme [Sphingomonadaceae bacterium]
MHKHHSALGVATTLRPAEPVTCLRPHAAERAAGFFLSKFPGKTLYAVKANPSPELIRTLWGAGVTHYDVASIAEVRLVRRLLPEATLCFMHPVKAPEAIAEAYHRHGVRTFSLDSHEELQKIVKATGAATDLTLCVRLRVSNAHAKLSLGAKFGVSQEDAPSLLLAARQAADALGLCFHVGSQTMSPAAYADAMAMVRAAIVAAGVTVDVVDVGGGFPSIYPGMDPAPMEAFFATIHRQFEALPISYSAELWAEPGRALCAEYASVVVRVERRKRDVLYINDGAYGSLFDAAHIGWRFPVRLLRETESRAKPLEFQLYGPTCDDLDHMKGPFMLPADIQPGDYIEIGMLGAYGSAMRTEFNGFGLGHGETVVVEDEPMASVYIDREDDVALPANVVALR